jgi:hypothetical protein
LAKFTWRAEEEMGENHLDEHEEKEVVGIIGDWNVWIISFGGLLH